MEIGIVKFVQSIANSFFDVFFLLITKMGEETFFLLLLAMVYLCYSKSFAFKMTAYYVISFGVNNFVKAIFQRPRPYVASSEVLNRLEAGGFSFPSGHTQGFFVSSTTGFIEINKKNNSKKIKNIFISIVLSFGLLVMISRLYWGQHYLSDVVVGMMFGMSIPFVLDWLLTILPQKITRFFTLNKLFVVLGVLSFVIFIFLLILEIVFGVWSSVVYKFLGVFVAMSIGYFVDYKFIHYNSNQGFKIGVLKYIIALIVCVGLYFVIDLIFSIDGYINFIVYLFLGIICTIILPILFKFLFKRLEHE